MAGQLLMEMYDAMLDHFGHQQWWPGDSRFEIIIGAILTQNTNWTNVEKAIANLKAQNALDPAVLHEADHEDLAQWIRPAGYFNIKAKRLKNFLNWLFENCNGDPDGPAAYSPFALRESLLSINGIGPETADSIALYAYQKPVFVVDTYTCRIGVRHGLLTTDMNYDMIQEYFQSCLPDDVRLFNEYHALLVCVGKNFCKPKPKCEKCPLNPFPHEIEPLF